MKGLKRTSKFVFDVVIERNIVEKYKRKHLNSILIPPYTGERREREKRV